MLPWLPSSGIHLLNVSQLFQDYVDRGFPSFLSCKSRVWPNVLEELARCGRLDPTINFLLVPAAMPAETSQLFFERSAESSFQRQRVPEELHLL